MVGYATGLEQSVPRLLRAPSVVLVGLPGQPTSQWKPSSSYRPRLRCATPTGPWARRPASSPER